MLEIHSIREQFIWIYVHLIYDKKILEGNQTTLKMLFGKSRLPPGLLQRLVSPVYKNKFKVLYFNKFTRWFALSFYMNSNHLQDEHFKFTALRINEVSIIPALLKSNDSCRNLPIIGLLFLSLVILPISFIMSPKDSLQVYFELHLY